MGTVNAFAGGGSALENLIKDMDPSKKPYYCDNETHAFEYSASFNYETPECQYVVPEQLVTKGNSQVSIASHARAAAARTLPRAHPGRVEPPRSLCAGANRDGIPRKPIFWVAV